MILCLRRIGIGSRFFEALVGLLQIDGIESGRNFAVGSAGPIDLLRELAVWPFHDARVERILFAETLQVLKAYVLVERVGTGLDCVFAAGRTLGGDHGLKSRIEE